MPVIFAFVQEGFFDSFWVAVHLATGMGLGALLPIIVRNWKVIKSRRDIWMFALLLLIAWEIFEVGLREVPQSIQGIVSRVVHKGYFEDESIVNIIGDIIVGMVGYVLGTALVRRKIQL
jgi:general stress protein CsbA